MQRAKRWTQVGTPRTCPSSGAHRRRTGRPRTPGTRWRTAPARGPSKRRQGVSMSRDSCRACSGCSPSPPPRPPHALDAGAAVSAPHSATSCSRNRCRMMAVQDFQRCVAWFTLRVDQLCSRNCTYSFRHQSRAINQSLQCRTRGSRE